jgi:hypothetical protein
MSISGRGGTTQVRITDGWRRLIELLEDAETVGRLGATFHAAVEFGLDDREIWATIMEVCNRTSRDLDGSDPLEELSAALAARILEHERRAHSHS